MKGYRFTGLSAQIWRRFNVGREAFFLGELETNAWVQNAPDFCRRPSPRQLPGSLRSTRSGEVPRNNCNGPIKLDTELLFERVDDYDDFSHWAANSIGVR